MSVAPQDSANPDKADSAEELHLDEHKILALTEFVEKLGGMERAKEAVEALRHLTKAS